MKQLYKTKKGKLKKCKDCKDAALDIDIAKFYYIRCACGKLCTAKYTTIDGAIAEWGKLRAKNKRAK